METGRADSRPGESKFQIWFSEPLSSSFPAKKSGGGEGKPRYSHGGHAAPPPFSLERWPQPRDPALDFGGRDLGALLLLEPWCAGWNNTNVMDQHVPATTLMSPQAVAPIIPVSRPSFCQVPPGMRSIHPHKWHLCGWIERIPGATWQNDGLETGIMGAAAARLAWTVPKHQSASCY